MLIFFTEAFPKQTTNLSSFSNNLSINSGTTILSPTYLFHIMANCVGLRTVQSILFNYNKIPSLYCLSKRSLFFFWPLSQLRQTETQIKCKKVSVTYLFLFFLLYIQYSNIVLLFKIQNSAPNLISHIKVRMNI